MKMMELRPIVVDDNNIIIGGNQRYFALRELGKKKIPESWVRKVTDFTEEQRKRFIVVDNSPEGMSGYWDFDLLNLDFGAEELEALGVYQLDKIDYDAEWKDMPEFDQKQVDHYKDIKISFMTEDDYQDFAKLIGQNLTENTKSIWYPKPDTKIRHEYSDKDAAPKISDTRKDISDTRNSQSTEQAQLKYPVYIPSRGRCQKSYTADVLKKHNILFFLVVEPQEKEQYIEKFGEDQIIVLPKNNQGVAYVRNYIKRHSTQKGEAYHWSLDDNIRGFRRRIDKKNIREIPNDMMIEAENYVDQYSNIGIAGLRNQMFAFSAKTDHTFNNQVYCCVLINNAVKVQYRKDVAEDIDYSLQVLDAGYCTVLFNRLLLEKIATETMPGGCTEIEYGEDGRKKRNEGLQRLWPGAFEMHEKYGRVALKPSRIWRTFKQQPELKNES